MSTEFQREDRYIVIKRSDLKKVPVAYRSHLADPMFSLLSHLPHRECLVIESDWPEYEPTWAAIQARVTGQSAEQSPGKPVGEVVAFGEGLHEIAWAQGKLPRLGARLYTHADPGEVERLTAANTEFARRHLEGLAEVERLHEQVETLRLMTNDYLLETERLRAQLAERDALLLDLIHIAEDREQGYADKLHGGVINGKAADALVAMLDRMRVAISASAEPSAPLPPIEGDLLPAIGSKVLIHLAREDKWVEHTVVGYYVWDNLRPDPSVHRVFVRVRDDQGYLNARMLGDIRPAGAALGRQP